MRRIRRSSLVSRLTKREAAFEHVQYGPVAGCQGVLGLEGGRQGVLGEDGGGSGWDEVVWWLVGHGATSSRYRFPGASEGSIVAARATLPPAFSVGFG